MSRRPSFQFYPADWMANKNLRRCSRESRSVWMDIICLLHDSDEYGVLRWSLDDLAQASNSPIELVIELYRKEVLKGIPSQADIAQILSTGVVWSAGELSQTKIDAFIIRADLPLTHTPNHAGTKGEPITLIPEQEGSIWFSSRMVLDEHFRVKRGAMGKESANNPNTPRKIEKKNFDPIAAMAAEVPKEKPPAAPVVKIEAPVVEIKPVVPVVSEQQSFLGIDVVQPPLSTSVAPVEIEAVVPPVKAAPKSGAKSAELAEKAAETAPSWEAYSQAILERHGVMPVRDALANKAIRKAVDSLGKDVAPKVLAHYVKSNDAFIVRNVHSLGLFMQSINRFFIEWSKAEKGQSSMGGGPVTRAQIREVQAGMHHNLGAKNYREGVDAMSGQLTD